MLLKFKNKFLLIQWYLLILPLVNGLYLKILLIILLSNFFIIALFSWLLLLQKLIIFILPAILDISIYLKFITYDKIWNRRKKFYTRRANSLFHNQLFKTDLKNIHFLIIIKKLTDAYFEGNEFNFRYNLFVLINFDCTFKPDIYSCFWYWQERYVEKFITNKNQLQTEALNILNLMQTRNHENKTFLYKN